MPERIQLSRRKGWRMPGNTVSVARPGMHGNPYIVRFDPDWNGVRINALTMQPIIENGPWLCEIPKGPKAHPEAVGGWWFADKRDAAVKAVALFRLRATELLIGEPIRERLPSLRGKNLACWCKLGEPCHADVLLELANAEPGE